MDRRSFLSSAATMATLPLLPGCSSIAGTANWAADGDLERQRLIAMADFMPTKTSVSGDKGLAICTHPLATKAAIDAMKDGGNAVDGACAAAIMQTVVEPHMTSLTGVFSMLYYEAASGKSYYLNGSNNRPLKHRELSVSNPTELGSALTPIDYICTPGYWGGWQAAQDRFGKLSRKRVMAPSIYYAREGFEVHPFLWAEIFVMLEKIGANPQGREVYMPNNTIIGQHKKLYQKRYADLLARLAEEGNDYFYHGKFADNFSETIQKAGGVITPEDFARYQVMWQEPAKGRYRDYDLIASPPPDFGGTNVAEVLQILEQADLKKMGPASESPETAYLMIKALNEVWADTLERNHGVTKHKSWQEMLNHDYAVQRYERIVKNAPRVPIWQKAPPGSNHLTVTDGEGNVATVLHSHMGAPWGSGLFVDGAMVSQSGGHYFAGLPRQGGRINSAVVPTMVMKNGRPIIAGGSPSVSLQECVLQNITNVLDFGMSIEESVNLPRFGGDLGFSGRLIEADMGDAFIKNLSQKTGIKLKVVNPRHFSHGSFDGIVFNGKTASACGDPRRTATPMAV